MFGLSNTDRLSYPLYGTIGQVCQSVKVRQRLPSFFHCSHIYFHHFSQGHHECLQWEAAPKCEPLSPFVWFIASRLLKVQYTALGLLGRSNGFLPRNVSNIKIWGDCVWQFLTTQSAWMQCDAARRRLWWQVFFHLSLRVWKFGTTINTFAFRCGQTTCCTN